MTKFLQGSERVYGLGYHPNPYDGRDRPVERLLEHTARGSSSLDSLIGSPPAELYRTDAVLYVGDQGITNSCVIWAIQQSVSMRQWIQDPSVVPSRINILAPYWDFRTSKIEDAGMHPRRAFQGLREKGYCAEEVWPFDPKKVYDTPPPKVRAGSFDQIGKLEYYMLHPEGYGLRVSQCKAALAAGFPVNFAVPVNRSFADYKGGIWTFQGDPYTAEWHYLTMCGYNRHGIMAVNSWGPWGTIDQRMRPGFVWIGWEMVEDRERFIDAYAITLASKVSG